MGIGFQGTSEMLYNNCNLISLPMAFIKEFLTPGVHQECKDASLDTFWLQRNTQTKINLDFYLINKHICIHAYLHICAYIYIYLYVCEGREKI